MKITDYFVLIIALGALIYVVYKFFKKPSKQQIESVKQWLIYACIEAEKLLGSKTGILKLRYVYDLFVTKFPWLAQIISFEYFSKLVNEALETVRRQLENNEAIKNIVVGSSVDNESEEITANK